MSDLLPDSFDQLSPVTEGVWHIQRRFAILGIPAATRMTVLRLSDGGLWLHSPVRLDAALQSALQTLGPVRHIVAPSQFHHLFVQPYLEAFPQAQLHVAPGLDKKVPALSHGQVLGRCHVSWKDDIDQLLLQGVPGVDEVVFLHKTSRTLILTDSVQWMPAHDSLRARIVARIMGVQRQAGMSRIFKAAIQDRAAFKASRDALLAWDFDRVLMCHDVAVARGGKALVRKAMAWLD